MSATVLPSAPERLTGTRRAALVFLVFAFAYFLSTLVRGITATLSPTLTTEFDLNARDLGLLAGGYFLGFALTQLPMGTWLDRYGPRRVVLCFLSMAVVGCLLFSVVNDFAMLLAARVLTGVGVSACLMAPLTGYRRWFDPALQLRGNAWMLMVGSLGMVGATLPVQWLVPLVGWRPLFWLLAGGVALSMVLIALVVPAWRSTTPVAPPSSAAAPEGYAAIFRDPFFRKVTPIGFFSYGGFMAMQTLWVVPWLTRVAGQTAAEAARALFFISVALLVTYWAWGVANPWLVRQGIAAERLLKWGLPFSMVLLAAVLVAGPAAGAGAWTVLLCASTVVTLAQPAVAMALPPALAGRALSAYNLVIFLGIFTVQWGIGLLIDLFAGLGFDTLGAFRGAFTVFLVCAALSYFYFLRAPPHNRCPSSRTA